MSATKPLILRRYGVSAKDLIRKGMEAEVYAMGSDAILKLYIGTTHLAQLTTLQHFYASLNRQALSYALPDIQMIAAEGDICTSIERRLPGSPMSEIIPTLPDQPLDRMMQSYLTAALELKNIQIPPDFDRYKLFDAEGISHRKNGDWHTFLARFLAAKLAQVSAYLNKDVTDFAMKVKGLNTHLAQPYTGDYHLIHGDFFPGNLLVNEQHQITALLDFGLLTMYGDFLFDIATGWVFFDMYDELKKNIRERYLGIILEALGEQIREKLYFYVLLYSVLSANTYSSKCADGHYQWCVKNLNHEAYWDDLESIDTRRPGINSGDSQL